MAMRHIEKSAASAQHRLQMSRCRQVVRIGSEILFAKVIVPGHHFGLVVFTHWLISIFRLLRMSSCMLDSFLMLFVTKPEREKLL